MNVPRPDDPWILRPAASAALAALVLAAAACASSRGSGEEPARTTGAAAGVDAEVAAAHPGLNATLWMQRSVEYEATARQAWLLARRALDRALDADASPSALPDPPAGDGGRPPAVVVDVDETVLDNSPYQARLAREGAEFDPASWHAWVREEKARAVPGALEALREADRRGVDVYYVTNRDHEVEPATRDNLEALGFPLDAPRDAVLTRGEREGWGSDKASRRAAVARHHRVVLLVGDDLNDFVSVEEAGPEERASSAAEHAERWGESWIMLPNPAYGSWESAAWGHRSGLSPGERRALKLQSLDPARDDGG
jgi:acid phosphatase